MRVGLVGDNSVYFVRKLIEIWNKDDCAVVVDWRIPFVTIHSMLQDAEVERCYVDSEIWSERDGSIEYDIEYIPYECEKSISLLESEDVCQFKERYDEKEALILFSSGTTGKAKGIIMSHFAIQTNADAIADYLQIHNEDSILIAKSMAHSSSLVGELLVGLKNKISVVISPCGVNVGANVKIMDDYNITIIGMNPTMLYLYSLVQKERNYSLKKLKVIYVYGAGAGTALLTEAEKLFRCKVLTAYGLTEAGPRVTAQSFMNSKTNTRGGSGRPIKNVEVKIVKQDEKEAVPGEKGIIYVKTPSRCLGYISGKGWDTEWINTGDIGYLDISGELFVTGRADNMISISAHNVYPEEIEKYLLECQGIEDCIILPKEDAVYGNRLYCYYIGEKKNTVELRRYCAERLAPYEIPKEFVHVEKIFCNRNGKKERNIMLYNTIEEGIKFI